LTTRQHRGKHLQPGSLLNENPGSNLSGNQQMIVPARFRTSNLEFCLAIADGQIGNADVRYWQSTIVCLEQFLPDPIQVGIPKSAGF